MRLLNKTTLKIETFVGDDVPEYIILSHRWIGRETSLQDFALEMTQDVHKWSPGTAKIVKFCQTVKPFQEEYVWADTVCIDKTSSAELQEAINSMFRWYTNAKTCLVYLEDVHTTPDAKDPSWLEDTLPKSAWFTRGWTLQELLAPKDQVFLDSEWNTLGTRGDLAALIEQITGIRRSYYGKTPQILSATVAERMSWLSERTTTRIEDMAYCLLGIFGINMTMLYGEGHNAFRRLQREIMNEIDDETIFLRIAGPVCFGAEEGGRVHVLADSPSHYLPCKGRRIEKDIYFHRAPLRQSTKGIEIQLYGERYRQFGTVLRIYLNCTVDGKRAYFDLARTRADVEAGSNTWSRVSSTSLQTADDDKNLHVPPTPRDIYERATRDMMIPKRQHVPTIFDFEQEKIFFTVFVR